MTLLEKDQVALYDRQIRVWGMTAQQKILTASVLIVGIHTQVSHEVSKNLVLAGIGNIHFLEVSELHSKEDSEHCLFFRSLNAEDDKLSVLKSKLQTLNPSVKVSIYSNEADVKLSDISLILCCTTTYQLALEWNEKARSSNIKFYYSISNGWIGWNFCDYLDDYSYYPYSAKDDKRLVEQPLQLPYVSLPSCIEKLRKYLIADYLELSERQKTRNFTFEHAQNLIYIYQHWIVGPEVISFLDEDYQRKLLDNLAIVGRNLAPTASILGGQCAQDVIRGITNNDEPIANFLVYDGYHSIGKCHRFMLLIFLKGTRMSSLSVSSRVRNIRKRDESSSEDGIDEVNSNFEQIFASLPASKVGKIQFENEKSIPSLSDPVKQQQVRESDKELIQNTNMEIRDTLLMEADHKFIQKGVDIHNELSVDKMSSKTYQGLQYYDSVKARANWSSKSIDDRASPLENPSLPSKAFDRQSATLKSTVRFDYQPHVCKDYKETGFCGFGDSCIFLHDRGNYKQGWELDQEWNEKQKQRDVSPVEAVVMEEKEEIPHNCPICQLPFKKPVLTKCGHYFDEKCAIQRFNNSSLKTAAKLCFVCSLPTNGSFVPVSKEILSKMKEKLELEVENRRQMDRSLLEETIHHSDEDLNSVESN